MPKKFKEERANVHIRVPQNIHDDLNKIAAEWGITLNALCLEIFREGIKKRLKDEK
jgi:predicted HicB family RNase H-like nuclease